MESPIPLVALLDMLWRDYLSFNPYVKRIFDLFIDRGEVIQNDHIAFRTFRDPKIGLSRLAFYFEQQGYRAIESYEFSAKRLFAKHFEHADPKFPRLFISELLVDSFDTEFSDLVHKLIREVPIDLSLQDNFSMSGRPWQITIRDYEALQKKSEYGAWVGAFGFRPNHFTVNVNALKTFQELQEVTGFLTSHGIVLNNEGGEIKGSPKLKLEH